MKQETNNEMDLLLRRLARRQDVFAPHAEDHLDADELNAYAENVLPAKTRARHTEHLAECTRCRELVVQLSASAGVVIADQAGKVSEPSGWKKFLATLFSPMVFKYAAPALGLIIVAAIGVIVLRRDQSANLVSQVQPQRSNPAGVSTQEAETKQQPHVGLSGDVKPAESTITKETQKKDLVTPSPTPAPQGNPAPAEQAATKAAAPKPESQPVVAAAEPPAPSPTKLDAADETRARNDDAGRKQEAEVKVAQAEVSKKNYQIDGEGKRGEASPPATARARAAKSKPVFGDLASAQGAAGPGAARREGADRDDKEKDSSAETRYVAGRRFRKLGGVWTDTAYDSSTAITTYNRGSESYRSLIADEPAIKTIADQLDGEIIVVWKGHTYRIK
jgi:hypothetical protein